MAVTDLEPHRLSSPRIFLVRMALFLALAILIAIVLYEQIINAFMANPGLNGLIFGVLGVGIALAFRQVTRLLPEVRWVNSYRVAEPGIALRDSPVMLAPMASLLGNNRMGPASVSTVTLRSILDSVGTRLDESRDMNRYLTGLLVFLGLLGTFWGLLETVGSISQVIGSLGGEGDSAVIFEDLKQGLAAPLSGMGIAFSSSLFGLAGSLVLGFLDLQASQAQNRFYNELEDWLSTTVTNVSDPALGEGSAGASLTAAIERMQRAISEGSGTKANQAMAQLAEGIQGLVHHMRSEQQMIRDWVEAQAEDQKEVRRLLAKIASNKIES
ncbi:hypothetical protein GCM10007276_15200 [Agaricicola taiwanensis]|uniref:Flagellar motor protein MotA n=1 Tax=Agaricicola taiwanensis TaxID=591372 RepID=A0A8J2VUM6_9RHOB|nr:flagellar motor protein MotA [Agaricicola taiwanensis]GGE38834.1 hypothetical protein GCM10007276_15200 [Agaricicola taiwanensis]